MCLGDDLGQGARSATPQDPGQISPVYAGEMLGEGRDETVAVVRLGNMLTLLWQWSQWVHWLFVCVADGNHSKTE